MLWYSFGFDKLAVMVILGEFDSEVLRWQTMNSYLLRDMYNLVPSRVGSPVR
jgi:hypothetical protein